ncbi:hypothetical protein SAMN04488516_10180 [Desulfonauticus submarinus]|uniref:Uncharacterized protein n=1 Tax=Desulfonauticus submarinus TaxID=206665 RepID=A0A1G9ZLE2_9BACT|nr:hypothetical protein SAMN04488516_10180 [Desulfonauticus submarinus]
MDFNKQFSVYSGTGLHILQLDIYNRGVQVCLEEVFGGKKVSEIFWHLKKEKTSYERGFLKSAKQS